MSPYGLSPTGNPLTKFVNLFQSKEERQQKYWLVRSVGGTPNLAYRLRDWRLCRVEEYLKNWGYF